MPDERPGSAPQDGAFELSEHEALLERARRREPSACRALVVRHQGLVLGQLRGILLPAAKASAVEDLAQETFLRAFRALDRFEGGPRRFRAWLLTIATRAALKELARKRPRLVPLDTVEEPRSQRRGHPEVHGRLVGRGLEQALAELPAPFRAAFLLKELHGLRCREIASILEVDVGTVKSRLSRARARLRLLLKETHDG